MSKLDVDSDAMLSESINLAASATDGCDGRLVMAPASLHHSA